MNSTPHPRPGNADILVGGFSSFPPSPISSFTFLASPFSASPISSFCPLVSAFPKSYPFSFHTLAHSFSLFFFFFHFSITQLFSFQSFAHSLPKTTRGGGTPPVRSSFLHSILQFFLPPTSHPLCF